MAMCIITGICALLGLATGALVGFAAGLLSGAWTGPGAAATSVIGLFSGAVGGWAIGLVVATLLTGVIFGTVGLAASGYGFFKPSEKDKLVNNVMESKNSIILALS